jgi:hypothetical protein
VTIPGFIGRHDLRRQGDLLILSMHGPLTVSDIKQLREVLTVVMQEVGPCFIVADLSGATSLDADARKYMAEWSKENTDWVAGTVVHGVSFAMRALLTLTLKAIKFLGTQQVEFVFVKDEAEAIQWVDAKRLALYPDRR